MKKITVNQVEGKTSKKGTKQNQVYTIVSEQETKNFYTAQSESGKLITLWNVNKDWSILGIMRYPIGRCTYTKKFTAE